MANGESNSSGGSALKEIVITLVVAAGLAFGLQGFIVKPYKIPSASMENTLRCGDRVLVNRIGYRFGDPKRHDIVVFHPPRVAGISEDIVPTADRPPWKNGDEVGSKESRQTYIKRVVGLPGDELEVRDRHVFINQKKLNEPFIHPVADDRVGGPTAAYTYGPIKVPKGTYFMMGDNRTESADARWFGPVKRDFIIGKAFAFYWPLGKVGGISSDHAGSIEADPACSAG